MVGRPVADVCIWVLRISVGFIMEIPIEPAIPPDTSRTELAAALRKWAPILKGTTVMADGARPQAPCERIDAETYAQATAATVGQAIDECATGACPVR